MISGRTDNSIRDEVLALIRWDPRVPAGDVEIYVEDGKVQLSGSVPTRQVSLVVAMIASGVMGVRSVENHLHVRHETSPRSCDPRHWPR